MATTPKPAQQPPVRIALDGRKVVSIFVLRLQSPIRQKTAVIVILEKPECNPMLCIFYVAVLCNAQESVRVSHVRSMLD